MLGVDCCDKTGWERVYKFVRKFFTALECDLINI